MEEEERLLTEIDEQKNFILYVRQHYPEYLVHSDTLSGEYSEDSEFSHNRRIMNGGFRGYPDVFLPIVKRDNEGHIVSCGLFLEFKKKNAKLARIKDGTWLDVHTAEQAEILQWLNDNDYTAVFARGYDEAIQMLEGYLGHTEAHPDSVTKLNEMIDYIATCNDKTRQLRPDIERQKNRPYLVDNDGFRHEYDYSTNLKYLDLFDEQIKAHPEMEYWRACGVEPKEITRLRQEQIKWSKIHDSVRKYIEKYYEIERKESEKEFSTLEDDCFSDEDENHLMELRKELDELKMVIPQDYLRTIMS